MFAAHGYGMIGQEPWPFDDFTRFVASNATLVAVDGEETPLGFAVSAELHGICWLKELSVDPDHGRIGVGTALLRAVEERARWALHSAVGMSTFRDVPFNAPFYRRRGYVTVPLSRAEAPIRAQVEREVPPGAQLSDRVLMLRKL